MRTVGPPRASRGAPGQLGRLALLTGVLVGGFAQPTAAQAEWHVGPGQRWQRIGAAIAEAPAGATIVVHAGTYRESGLRVTRPLRLVGRAGAVLDGGGAGTVIAVEADDVTIDSLTITGTGTSQLEERAGIHVRNAAGCRITGNRIEDALFGIYLERVRGCRVEGNRVAGPGARQMAAGNGIHAWSSDSVVIRRNDVRGHRDGIYFEFVRHGEVSENTSERNVRYALHFMFSDDCRYERNVFRASGNGVAVMYSKRVTMVRNRFVDNWGSAAYGLLLKDIDDSHVEHNEFAGNSVGLYLEDASRNQVASNAFARNGWALKVLASAQDNVFEGNLFERNTFDVGTNSRSSTSTFRRNYWDRYRGYDLDRDGIGDVPHLPVRLFALVVEQAPATLVLLRSVFVDLLDVAERAIPSLTPSEVRDVAPLVAPPRPTLTARPPAARNAGEGAP